MRSVTVHGTVSQGAAVLAMCLLENDAHEEQQRARLAMHECRDEDQLMHERTVRELRQVAALLRDAG